MQLFLIAIITVDANFRWKGLGNDLAFWFSWTVNQTISLITLTHCFCWFFWRANLPCLSGNRLILKKTIAHWTRTFVHHPPPEIQQSSEKSPIAGQHQVQADSGGSRGGSCPGYCDHHPSLIYGCCNIGHPTSVHVSLLSVHMFLLPLLDTAWALD